MPNPFDTAFTPIQLRGLTLRNRFIKSATYEGMTPEKKPTQQLIDFHSRMAAGGIGMTTVAYGAVNGDARTNFAQMIMREEILPELTKLTAAIHHQGGAAMIQLTHCGFFTNNKEIRNKRPLAPSVVMNQYGLLNGLVFSRSMLPEDLENIKQDFARSAIIAVRAGFDAVEIHMGHGYLLSQFLSPATNRRKDEYGGSIENRMRYPLEVLRAVRESTGDSTPIFCKINMDDGFKSGLTLEESLEFAGRLETSGADALVLSGGFTSKTPFYLMRGDIPLREMTRAERNLPQKMAMGLFGRMIIRKYKFEENFFFPLALRVRKAVKMPLVYLGGVVSCQGIEQVMDAGFDMIGMARALIHDPDFISHLKEEKVNFSECDHCNICVAEMERGGVRCVLK